MFLASGQAHLSIKRACEKQLHAISENSQRLQQQQHGFRSDNAPADSVISSLTLNSVYALTDWLGAPPPLSLPLGRRSTLTGCPPSGPAAALPSGHGLPPAAPPLTVRPPEGRPRSFRETGR